MKKLHTNKGFTLAELLIVVAIIAVMVAVAIPAFTAQLENSRESTDIANIRDWYAEISVALANGDFNPKKQDKPTLTVTGKHTAKVSKALDDSNKTEFIVTVTPAEDAENFVHQTVEQWQSGPQTVGGITIGKSTNMVNATTVNYVFTVEEASDDKVASTYLSDINFGEAPSGGSGSGTGTGGTDTPGTGGTDTPGTGGTDTPGTGGTDTPGNGE